MGDYAVFLTGSYRCLGVIRALVSTSRSASFGTQSPKVKIVNEKKIREFRPSRFRQPICKMDTFKPGIT